MRDGWLGLPTVSATLRQRTIPRTDHPVEAEMVRPNGQADRELRRVWTDLLLGGAEILLLTAIWTLILVVPLTYTAW